MEKMKWVAVLSSNHINPCVAYFSILVLINKS